MTAGGGRDAGASAPPSGESVLIHRVVTRLNVGGPAMHVVHLTEALSGGPFETRLVAGRITPDEGDMAYFARERGAEVTRIPAMSRRIEPLRDARALAALIRLFRRERPAIVHTHLAMAGALGRTAAAIARVPVRIHTFHGHVLGGDYFAPAATRAFLAAERGLARLTHRIVALTGAQARELSEGLRVASLEKLRVIPLGLDLDAFVAVDRGEARARSRRELGLPPDEAVVGIVGRMVPVKNHELLFDAAARTSAARERPVRVLVVGSGEREEALRRHAERLGVGDRVTWLGWRERSELPELYAAMDVLALPSKDEGTPVAVIEALAAGTPVVARAVGGVPEVLEEAGAGRLVEEEDAGALAAALGEALDGAARGAGREARERARARVRDRYSVDRLARDTVALYREELERAGVAAPRDSG